MLAIVSLLCRVHRWGLRADFSLLYAIKRQINWLYEFQEIGCSLRWHHNGRDGVSNNQPHHFLLNRLFRRRSKKTSKLRVTGLCKGNSSVTGEFPAQMTSNTENVSIWWCHHVLFKTIWANYDSINATTAAPFLRDKCAYAVEDSNRSCS